MISTRSIEVQFFIPHCTGCYEDLDQGCKLYQAACGHMYCQRCMKTEVSNPMICGVDAVPTAQGKAIRREDLEKLIEAAVPTFANSGLFAELVTDIFSGINTNYVSCKYVRKGIPCPSPVQCKYSHEAATEDLRKSGTLECVKCKVRMKPGTVQCPFCKETGTKVVEYAVPAVFFPSDAESLTSSLDLMKSMDPSFSIVTSPLQKPAIPTEPKAAKSDLGDVLKCYIDLAMSDSEEEAGKTEELVVIGPVEKPAVLRLLGKLWEMFRGSVSALYARLVDKRENTMVFYQ